MSLFIFPILSVKPSKISEKVYFVFFKKQMDDCILHLAKFDFSQQ